MGEVHERRMPPELNVAALAARLAAFGGLGGPLGGLWRPWWPARRPLIHLGFWRSGDLRTGPESTFVLCWYSLASMPMTQFPGGPLTARWRPWRPTGGPLRGPGGPLAARLAALAARWRLAGGPGGLWRPARGGPGGPGGLLAALTTLGGTKTSPGGLPAATGAGWPGWTLAASSCVGRTGRTALGCKSRVGPTGRTALGCHYEWRCDRCKGRTAGGLELRVPGPGVAPHLRKRIPVKALRGAANGAREVNGHIGTGFHYNLPGEMGPGRLGLGQISGSDLVIDMAILGSIMTKILKKARMRRNRPGGHDELGRLAGRLDAVDPGGRASAPPPVRAVTDAPARAVAASSARRPVPAPAAADAEGGADRGVAARAVSWARRRASIAGRCRLGLVSGFPTKDSRDSDPHSAPQIPDLLSESDRGGGAGRGRGVGQGPNQAEAWVVQCQVLGGGRGRESRASSGIRLDPEVAACCSACMPGATSVPSARQLPCPKEVWLHESKQINNLAEQKFRA
eukprot:gene2607-biopygen7809